MHTCGPLVNIGHHYYLLWFFVLVNLFFRMSQTIRRLESFLRSTGATVKILSTVPDDCPAEELKDIIVVPGMY